MAEQPKPTQEQLMQALQEVRYVTMHLEEPRRTAITQALMDMKPADRSAALQKGVVLKGLHSNFVAMSC